MKFAFQRLASRLTGISTPVFGVSWKPPELEVDVANELITYLEDRRMLYVPHAWENQQYVIKSVMETRAELTRILTRIDRGSPLSDGARAMRAACRRFLHHPVPPNFIPREEATDDDLNRPVTRGNFIGDLGQLRGVFGIHIARICAAYGIDVEEDLASILPESPEFDDLLDG